jgi:hypothetical protein
LMRIVEMLTERQGEDMRSYFARCAADPLALRIKRADLEDKFDIAPGSRLSVDAGVRVADRARLRLAWLDEIATQDSSWHQFHDADVDIGCLT